MESFSQLIELWPSKADLAADLSVPYGTVKQWQRRDSIPARYWQAVVDAGDKRGVGVSLRALADLADRSRAAAAE